MPSTMKPQAVAHELRGNLLIVTIDNPPVNSLSVVVRRRLLGTIETAEKDPAIKGILIVGAGLNFIGGADIREFGNPPLPPALPYVCNQIESCSKLVVVAMHGAALGGGLEVALAAHYRLAIGDAKLGLPEVQLGLLPGAGGTQRTARLLGAQAALDLMLSGRHVSAGEAHALGLIDRLGQSDDVLVEGLAYLSELLDAAAPVRRTRDAQVLFTDLPSSYAALAAARAAIAKTSLRLLSPLKIVDAVQAAIEKPFNDGLSIERQAFLQCLDSPQHAGLVHTFFSERAVLRAPETREAKARTVRKVGVVGGGTMGAGIAIALLDAGFPVTMVERDDALVARGRAHIERVYDGLIAKGRITSAEKDQALTRWTGGANYEALADADLVIEAVFEDFAVKQAVLIELDRVCKAGAIFATNTSYLDIDALAASISRPADVVGLHFFSPANIMRLLEVVVPGKVSAEVVATAFELAKTLRKLPVRAGVCDGFIGNRILAAYRTAADHLMEDGASPYQIDRAVRDFGFSMGPFQVVDLAGGDISWAARRRRAPTRDANARYVQISDRLCERGWFGQKTGRGYYRYAEDLRGGAPDPEVEAIVAVERKRAGIIPRTFTDEEIIRRYMAAMINEGAQVVHQRIALRPLDVDVTLLHGYGFPRYRGGPMMYADTVGLASVLADIREFAKEDPQFWQPSPLLIELADRNANFSSLNRSA
jgi:3-hydroxyacyl-CoA dehydrogenase